MIDLPPGPIDFLAADFVRRIKAAGHDLRVEGGVVEISVAGCWQPFSTWIAETIALQVWVAWEKLLRDVAKKGAGE